MASGIYKITCLSNGKSYIGSALNMKIRWRSHQNALIRQQHANSHLQRAWNKYGASAFDFSVVEQVEDPNHLLSAEQSWLDTTDNLFNICPVAGSSLGRIVLPETGRKISEALKGKPLSIETRRKMSESRKGRAAWNKGLSHTDETKRKMSLIRTGRVFTEETCRKIGEANHRRIVTDETKCKQTEAKLGNTYCQGRVLSEATKIKIGISNGIANRGKHRSEEQRRNYSIAASRRWAKLREAI
jgi:group I intron endonuclease